MEYFNSDTAIVIFSALVAAASFIGLAWPLVQRLEKREKYRDVIEKKRKALFEQAREQVSARPTAKTETLSAARRVASFYKLQSLAGAASIEARKQLLQAGIRGPVAPLVYLVARIVLPLVCVGAAMLLFSLSKREPAPGVTLMALFVAALFGFFLPRLLIKNMADKRQMEIAVTFPDALDLLLVCVQGGIGIEAAINRVAMTVGEHSEILAEEMGILSAELGLLNDRKSAYQGFADRAGSGPARSFATAMLQAEQYGTSVSKALRVLADESRDQRMALAEQKAAALPPKLTVPMILFFLPPLFVIILGPAFLMKP